MTSLWHKTGAKSQGITNCWHSSLVFTISIYLYIYLQVCSCNKLNDYCCKKCILFLTFDHISRACTDMHTLFKFLSCYYNTLNYIIWKQVLYPVYILVQYSRGGHGFSCHAFAVRVFKKSPRALHYFHANKNSLTLATIFKIVLDISVFYIFSVSWHIVKR